MNKTTVKRCLRNPYLYPFLAALIFTAFCIAVCFRLSLPASFKPAAYQSGSSIDRCYQENTRYVQCSVEQLYYSGYDYLDHGKIKGHFYYTLVDETCTIYLLSVDTVRTPENPPLSLTDLSFTATLRKNDASLKPLLEYMASDLKWDYAGLAKHTSTILISQYHYNAVLYILIGCITAAGIISALVLFVCALRHCKSIKQPQ